jgi:uncharacterized protein (DUF58 family)
MTKLLLRVKSKVFIRANRRVMGLLDGQYASLSRGRSMDFDDLRAYVAGDEVKDIDWKATARHGAPLVRNYSADRQHELLLVVDTGRNLAAVAESGEPKRELAVLVAGVLGYLSLRHGDRVSVIHGNADGVTRLRAATTEAQLEGLLRRIDEAPDLRGPTSDLPGLLRTVLLSVRRRCIVVVIADDIGMTDELEATTRLLQARHELLWCTVADADLVRGVAGGPAMYDVADDSLIPDFVRNNRRLAADFDRAAADRAERIERSLEVLGISHTRLTSEATVVPGLLAMLQRRAHARR